MSFTSVLVFGLLLGLRHAFEADHLVAVSTLVTPKRSLWKNIRFGYLGAWPLSHAPGRWRSCSHPSGEHSPLSRAFSGRLGRGHARWFRTHDPTRLPASADSPPPTYPWRKHPPSLSFTCGGSRTLPSTWRGNGMEASPHRYGPWISRQRRRAPADSGNGSISRGKPALYRVFWLWIHTGHGSRKSSPWAPLFAHAKTHPRGKPVSPYCGRCYKRGIRNLDYL